MGALRYRGQWLGRVGRGKRPHVAIVECGEEEALVGAQTKVLGHHTEINGLDVDRTLGDDDDVGAVEARHGLAQCSCRQHGVLENRAVIVHQYDVYARSDITVLEGIIE